MKYDRQQKNKKALLLNNCHMNVNSKNSKKNDSVVKEEKKQRTKTKTERKTKRKKRTHYVCRKKSENSVLFKAKNSCVVAISNEKDTN